MSNTLKDWTEGRIIGYDARENWLTLDQGWVEQRKQGFLYRLDVIKPLSVDTQVWPTIFESEQRSDIVERFGFQSSWADLATLQSAVTKKHQERSMRAWRMIAITLLLGHYSQEAKVPWESRLSPVHPDQRGGNWEFVGYDVADQWMLSALSNCGFLPGLDDVQHLRAEWGPRLNAFHLFQNIHDAILFKHFSDQRLRDDHAPCFVYGLWFVR